MSEQRPRLVLVNYLNTLPMLAGIREHLGDSVQLQLAHPADCAGILFSGQADYGLVPVGALLGREDWHRVTRFGIGCDGQVDTVCLFGSTPIAEWDEVLLDYQSRTSVLLTRVVLHQMGLGHLPLKPAGPGYESSLQGRRGGLIIGDRAIAALPQYPYAYDLGAWWKEQTGLPFIFALWVSRVAPDPAWEARLDAALETGLQSQSSIAEAHQAQYPGFDLLRYYARSIRYHIDERMLEGFTRFQEGVRALNA